jgi:hypothetical protein
MIHLLDPATLALVLATGWGLTAALVLGLTRR